MIKLRDILGEEWSDKYKRSIDCSNPKGFSQKAHCQGRKKREVVEEENEPTNPELWDRAIAAAKRKYDVYPSAYANAFASKWYKDKGGDWKTKKD